MLAPLLFLALAAELNGVWTGQGLTVTLHGATGSEQISDRTHDVDRARLTDHPVNAALIHRRIWHGPTLETSPGMSSRNRRFPAANPFTPAKSLS